MKLCLYFWGHSNITLTRFLRDYIYIPLGGNRKGNFRTYINLMAIFIIGGFWHGAGWTFIFWGFLHGFALVLHRAWSSLGFKLYTWLAWLVTFNFVNIAWVFFRAKECDDALKVLSGMLGLSGINLPNILSGKLAFLNHYGIEFGNFVINIKGDNFIPIWLLFGFILILVFRNTNQRINRFRLSKDNIIFYGVLCGVFLFVGVMFIGSESEFLYFNF
ncbi:hypothetical protein CRU99_13660 [Malaciobacter mytili]|nr:hypothetical protein CRU99_13660 [Malaciobacter mytili]